jgi:dUTP pyrophosphatase
MAKLYILTDSDELKELYSKHDGFENAGVDLYCPQEILVKARSQAKLCFNIRGAMSSLSDSLSLSYFLLPRSSIVKTPLRMSNSIGLIDSGYRGEIMAFVDNISDTDYFIERNQRLFQIVSPFLSQIRLEMTDSLPGSKRGEGGFGSTGK